MKNQKQRNPAAFLPPNAVVPIMRPVFADSTYLHVFRCECCGRTRRDEDRRESGSLVCRHCVESAGFYEE